LVTSSETPSAHNSRRRAFRTLSTSIDKTKGCGNILWVCGWALVPQANPGEVGRDQPLLFASAGKAGFAQFTKMLKWDAFALPFAARIAVEKVDSCFTGGILDGRMPGGNGYRTKGQNDDWSGEGPPWIQDFRSPRG
jgi:hypothetical protein